MTAPMKKSILDDLPEWIIQDIQSYLPEEDAVRNSLLSKSWLHAQSTLPWLRFHQSRFGSETNALREKFVKFVDETLVRYQVSNLLVEKFDLSVEIKGPELDSDHVETWLRSVSREGLKHLSLTAVTNDNICTIPFEIFSCEALRTLKIWVQDWGKLRCCPPCNPRIGCFWLQVLRLRRVHISDNLIGELLSNCPLLEEITLCHCAGFERIQVRDLHRLRVFDILALKGEIVEIDAPSLESFTCCGNKFTGIPCCFNIGASTSLTRLQLRCTQMEERSFEKFISKFPLLEKLIIDSNLALEGSLDIACPNLTELSVSWLHLQEIKVHAPKLVRFDYFGEPIPSFDFPGLDANQLKAYINVLSITDDFAPYAYFLWLSKVALRISGKLSILLHLGYVGYVYLNETELADLRGNNMCPLQNVEELSLWVDYVESPDSLLTIMDACFTLCHPRYIKAFRRAEGFCNFLLLELMDRRTLDACSSIRNVEVSLMCMVNVDEDQKSSPIYRADVEMKLLTVPWRDLIDGSATHEGYEFIRFTIDWSS